MSILHKQNYILSFEAGHCVSNSSFKWGKNINKQLNKIWFIVCDAGRNIKPALGQGWLSFVPSRNPKERFQNVTRRRRSIYVTDDLEYASNTFLVGICMILNTSVKAAGYPSPHALLMLFECWANVTDLISELRLLQGTIWEVLSCIRRASTTHLALKSG